MKDFLKSLLSRKFLLALIGGLVAFTNAYFDMGLSTDEVITVIMPILAYIGVEGIADIKER